MIKDRQFWESARYNNATFRYYYDRLIEMAVSRFEWKGLPDTVDTRYLELALLTDGKAVFFYDEVLGYLALRCAIGGNMSVYRIPLNRRAYAANGYQKSLTEKDSVIIFNNMLHTNSIYALEIYAKKLYNLDRAIEVNANAQKTPILVQCDENQRLTLKNAYMKFDGNEPVIYGDKNLNPNSLKVFQTGAPYVADRLFQLKTEIWNEALTYLGISNINIAKKERMITDEVTRNQGGIIASRFSVEEARKQGCKEIEKIFALTGVDCIFREDMRVYTADEVIGRESEDNE